MGNSESSIDLDNNNVSSKAVKRTVSQSPTVTRSASVRKPPASIPVEGGGVRRSKTTRHKDRSNLRRAVCQVTGLTLHQKALLARKWNRMDRGTIYEMGRRMFEHVFTENPSYLAYIDLKNEVNWWNHINFKIHVQRFVTVLIETMRRLKEPSTSIDILRDFGAIYAKFPKRVSAVYFERIANSMNEAAGQLQEKDHLDVEKTQSRMEEVTDSSSTDNTSNMCTSCTSLSQSSTQRYPRPLTTRHSESQMQTLKEESSFCSSGMNSRRCSHETNCVKSMCPITAEAWLVLSAFIANQIKFGYELEKLLINEMSKLGIDTLPCQVGEPSETESDDFTTSEIQPHQHTHSHNHHPHHRASSSNTRFSNDQQSQLV
uniref:GLOBIN domain-containing protein n=2 Tax=Caenorhabditis japonica TaxID=281687 RepID=A0A8R1DIA7_CAEJA